MNIIFFPFIKVFVIFLKVKTERVASFYEDNMLIYRCKDNKNYKHFEFCEDVVFAKMIDIDYTEYSCKKITL